MAKIKETTAVKELLHEAVTKHVKETHENSNKEIEKAFIANLKELGAQDGELDKIITAYKKSTEQRDLALEIQVEEDMLIKAIESSIEDEAVLPEALELFFADAKNPKEEEIAKITEAVNTDTVNKTVNSVNTLLKEKGKDITLTADMLEEAHSHLKEDVYKSAIEGDDKALDVLIKFLPEQEVDVEDDIIPGKLETIEAPIAPEVVAIKTPEEIHEEQVKEFEGIIGAYEKELTSQGVEGDELKTKVSERRKSLLNMVNSAKA